jgi:hypothetical protein
MQRNCLKDILKEIQRRNPQANNDFVPSSILVRSHARNMQVDKRGDGTIQKIRNSTNKEKDNQKEMDKGKGEIGNTQECSKGDRS